MAPNQKTRVFISYDYDHDLALKHLLVGQARHPDSPFFIEDWSVKYEAKGWKTDARTRIKRADRVIVICGAHTDTAVGVAAELAIAKEVGTPYTLLRGHKTGPTRRPRGASFWDSVHPWTWGELRRISSRSWWGQLLW